MNILNNLIFKAKQLQNDELCLFSFDNYNMKSGEVVQNIQFNSEIADVLANRRVVVVAFREKLAAFDACNLEARFTVTNCYPSPGVHANPIALGDRWLAYADQRLVGLHRCILILFYIFSIGIISSSCN